MRSNTGVCKEQTAEPTVNMHSTVLYFKKASEIPSSENITGK